MLHTRACMTYISIISPGRPPATDSVGIAAVLDIPPEKLYRVLDANCNRLREALRIVEECFRFVYANEPLTVELKQLRHRVKEFERQLDAVQLLGGRDTATDPFSRENRPEEMDRSNLNRLLTANLKRAQEAARVLEEFSKLSGPAGAS